MNLSTRRGGPGSMVGLLSIILLSVSAMTAEAATYVYVSMAAEQRIQTYRLDPLSGALAIVDNVAVDGAPGCLAIRPGTQILLASLRTTSSLASFRIDQGTGRLTLLSTAALPQGENAAFVTTDHSGRWLLSASYLAGTVVVHRLRDDGTIEVPAVQTVKTAKTAHCVAIDRSNKLVLVPHVTPNCIYQFHLDDKTGKLSEAGTVAGGVDKAGPRHMAFYPTQKLAYTSDEQGSSITAYHVDPAVGLTSFQTLSTLPPAFQGTNSTAEVKVHPTGKFVWVSNRGHDSLAGFAIDAQSGRLTPIGQTSTEKTPRSFELDPSGNFLIAAGEGNGRLAVYRIDTSTGGLSPIHGYNVGKSLTWVRAVDVAGE